MTNTDMNMVRNLTAQFVMATIERVADTADDTMSWITDTCTDRQTECWSVVWVFAAIMFARLLAFLSRQCTRIIRRSDGIDTDTDDDDDDNAAFYVRAHTIAPTTPPSKPGVQYVKLQRKRRTRLQ
jgi:hypothetical protein